MDNHLTHTELQTLEAFIVSKNVPFLDVQLEIIDHFASAIEDMRTTDPLLSVEEGMHKVYSKFPITGFGVWMLEIENNLKQLFLKNYLKGIGSFFTLPKIALTVSLFLGLWLFYNSVNATFSIWLLFIIAIVGNAYYHFTIRKKYQFNSNEKFKFIALKAYYDRQWIFTLPLALTVWLFYLGRHNLFSYVDTANYGFNMSLFTTFVLISFHIAQYEMPKQLEKILAKRYHLWNSTSTYPNLTRIMH